MKVKVVIVNAFVDGENGGNPAGVVLNADALTDIQKLNIAKKVGLSETAFVSESDVADFKLDFFTPEKQIAHCGHATIATFSLLSQYNLLKSQHTSKETIDGTRSIEIIGDFAYMSQKSPTIIHIEESAHFIFDALGVRPEDVNSRPVIVNTGNSFLIVGVKNLSALEQINVNSSAIVELSKKYNLIGVYVYSLQTNVEGRDASTRMFAPYYGIDEEAATGMAAGPLACYMFQGLGMKKNTFFIEQGYSMKPPSPSCIEVNLTIKKNQIVDVRAGGVGRISKELLIDI